MANSVTHLVATSDGGAGRAAQRIHRALQQQSTVESHFYEDQPQKLSLGRLTYVLNHIPILPAKFRGGVSHKFTPAFVPRTFDMQPESDLYHLHWVAGMISPKTLARIEKPVVWTLHDMWPLTGGCHYTGGCQKFTDVCKSCPAIGSSKDMDYANRQFSSFQEAFNETSIKFVAPSTWMADQAEQTAIGDVDTTVIPNCLDVTHFTPREQRSARRELGLPVEEEIILTGGVKLSDNRRKGGDLLQRALRTFGENYGADSATVIQFGDGKLSDQPLDVIELGWVSDGDLPTVYAAADVMAVPSRYESFGQTASEALACGTPVVAFETSGLKDVVADGKTGTLVEKFDTATFAEALHKLLLCEDTQEYGERARERAVNAWAPSVVAEAYRELYAQM